MTNVVLDTSAVMAWLQQEPGWEAVGRAFATENCRMSAVNLAELVAKSADRMCDHAELAAMIAELPIEIVPVDKAQAFATGLLRAAIRNPQSAIRNPGLSLGDRACLALAKSINAVALTADEPWLELGIDARIKCIR